MKTSIWICLLLVSTSVSEADEDRQPQTLRQAAADLLICSSAGWEGETGIIKGPNALRNQKLITEHFNGIQPAVYPAWGGFWPMEAPAAVKDFSFWTEPLSAQAEWAKTQGLFVLHHGLLAPNYYFPDWWKKSSYSAAELEVILKAYIDAVVALKQVDAWNMINELFLGGLQRGI